MAKTTTPVLKRIVNLPERQSSDPWDDPDYRLQQRITAQKREREERKEVRTIAARIKKLSNPEKVSKNEYNNLPLASD